MVTINPDLTQNRFLGGELNIWQPRRGYRAGADPVFLAASVDARAGQSVLELGCGAGVAVLCLGRRVPGLDLYGVEVQSDYADLAKLNGAENGIPLQVFAADIGDLPAMLRARGFDHVIANPPYFQRAHGTSATDRGRDTALAGDTPLSLWVDVAYRRLKPGGMLTLIQKTDRLPELLQALDTRFGAIIVKPLVPRVGRAADLVLVRALKGARAPFKLLPPLILHAGEKHEVDGDSYTDTARGILRGGGAVNFA